MRQGGFLTAIFLIVALLLGCGGSGTESAGTTGSIPPGFIRVSVRTMIRDGNDVPQPNTYAERIVPRTVNDIITAYEQCLSETYPQLTRTFYGHELIVDQNFTSAGYSPVVTLSSSGVLDHASFAIRTRELLESPGFLPQTAQYTHVYFDTFTQKRGGLVEEESRKSTKRPGARPKGAKSTNGY